MDISQYMEMFIDESEEHLQSLNTHILVLEREPDNSETINEIFRAAHSLKGMSGTMGYSKMQKLTHDMENVLQEVRNGNMKVTSRLVDVLFEGLDALEDYLGNIQRDGNEGSKEYPEISKSLNEILEEGLETKDTKTEDKEKKKEIKEEKSPEVVDSEKTEKEYGKYKFKNLNFEGHEKRAIAKAHSLGLNVVGLTIYLQEHCVLKGARAFMINRNIEEYGEIIKLHPSAQDLEDENYDLDYSAFIVTNESSEKIAKVVLGVSEVKEVVADYVNMSDEEVEKYSIEAEQEKLKLKADRILGNKPSTTRKEKRAVANRSVRVDIEKLDALMNQVSELIIAKNGLISLSEEPDETSEGELDDLLDYLERITTNLHESVMMVRMVPIESVVNRFPRMVRDISKQLDKQMELYMTGEETELDRTLIDEIGEPLMHLLRNAADHGLESNEERALIGKEPVGSIYLDAYQEGNTVVIEVRDDGRGINTEDIKRSELEKGHISQEQADSMSEKELIELLFKPSVSTAEKVTNISGRGVGLDVVKTKIEALGGDIEARTVLGESSTFIIRLPLTLAILQSLMVIIGGERYAIPLGNIQTVERVEQDEIKTLQGKEVIHLRDEIIPIIRVAEVLDCQAEKKEGKEIVIIIKKGDKQGGLVVDQLHGQQEIVIKSIGKYINSHKIVSGATILGNGDVALILDVNSLI